MVCEVDVKLQIENTWWKKMARPENVADVVKEHAFAWDFEKTTAFYATIFVICVYLNRGMKIGLYFHWK